MKLRTWLGLSAATLFAAMTIDVSYAEAGSAPAPAPIAHAGATSDAGGEAPRGLRAQRAD